MCPERYSEAPYYLVDAFTSEPFRGNPAAVCLMPCNLSEELYLSIAREANPVSETAFLEEDGGEVDYRMRWFSPKREVPLCGHGTLATAHVLFNDIGVEKDRLSFQIMVGVIYAERVSEGVRLDFPRNDPRELEPPLPVLEAMGLTDWKEVLYSDGNQKLVVLLENRKQVEEVQPDFDAMMATENTLGWRGVVVTSKGTGDYDFVSRYFAPWMGVNEDPVTGSNHTVLGPYWMEKLGKDKLRAYQASQRGGEIIVEITEDRAYLTGPSTTVIKGTLKYIIA
jgi:PhzF family phenazine biosynthesis protein